MLKLFIIGIVCLQSCMGFLSAAETNDTVDRDKVVQRLNAFTAAFNKGPGEDLGSYWTENAEFTVPLTGEVVEGREAIAQHLQKKQQELNGKTITLTPGKISFPTPDTAIVEGVVQFIDHGSVTERKSRKFELVKQNGAWYLDTIREIPVDLPPNLYSHLKDLDWLVGKWKDEDEDVSISFETKWDKFKNFLIQHFKTEIYGLEEMEGTQIIGWDPVAERIRCWVYDSDGGFGSGIWTKDGANWNVVMTYTLSDGRTASATHIYSKISDKSYTYSSIGRDVDGEVLPNIEPVTVAKEE